MNGYSGCEERRVRFVHCHSYSPVTVTPLYLFSVERVRVKVRATYRRDPALADAIAKLAAETVAALLVPEAAVGRKPE
jgi:hypothetical protein